jgi:glutamate dehydrogenase/leucine dehydrogenase
MSQLKVDTITDEAGTGSPDFPNGATINGAVAYSRDNILGTVSQSAGVPTGAIIERGSNANGEFVKYADGTMICSNRELTVATNTDVTLPSAFINNEYVVNPTHRASADRILATQDVSRTTTNFRMRVQDAAAGFVTVGPMDYIAIGRWF